MAVTQMAHVFRVRWCLFLFKWKALFVFNFQTYTRFLKQGRCFCWDRTKTFFVLGSNLDAPRMWFKPRKKNGIFATDHKGPKTDPSQGSSPDSPVCFLLGSGKDSAFFFGHLGECLMLSQRLLNLRGSCLNWCLDTLGSCINHEENAAQHKATISCREQEIELTRSWGELGFGIAFVDFWHFIE